MHFFAQHLTNKYLFEKKAKGVNNYGFQSESSGSVDIHFDLIFQTEYKITRISVKIKTLSLYFFLFFRRPLLMNKDKYKVKTSSVNSIKQNILSVVLAFQRAKKRMDSIRNDLTQNHLF